MGELKDKVQGTAKEAAGTVTGDDEMKNKGRAQETWGNVQGTANDVKNKVSNAVDNAKGDADEQANNTNRGT